MSTAVERKTRLVRPVTAPRPAQYAAPALEKGLDVLELLTGVPDGLTQSQIAEHLNRSLQEVYRMVVSLERRGYICRSPPGDAFRLTMKLYDMAVAYPPIAMLTAAAVPIMQRLSLNAQQAMLLSVIDGTSIRAIANVDSPAPLGFRVRLGTASPVARTASGRVLLAFQSPPMRAWTFEAMAEGGIALAELKRLKKRVEAVARSGYEFVSGETFDGITDVSFPILDRKGEALAALTMPFLKSVADKVSIERAAAFQFEAAVELCAVAGGTLHPPHFPLVDPLARSPTSE